MVAEKHYINGQMELHFNLNQAPPQSLLDCIKTETSAELVNVGDATYVAIVVGRDDLFLMESIISDQFMMNHEWAIDNLADTGTGILYKEDDSYFNCAVWGAGGPIFFNAPLGLSAKAYKECDRIGIGNVKAYLEGIRMIKLNMIVTQKGNTYPGDVDSFYESNSHFCMGEVKANSVPMLKSQKRTMRNMIMHHAAWCWFATGSGDNLNSLFLRNRYFMVSLPMGTYQSSEVYMALSVYHQLLVMFSYEVPIKRLLINSTQPITDAESAKMTELFMAHFDLVRDMYAKGKSLILPMRYHEMMRDKVLYESAIELMGMMADKAAE